MGKGGRPRSRWTSLAVACAGLLFLAAGCLGENVSTAPTLEVDRPTDSDEECPEVEILDGDAQLAPRLLPIGDHGKTWPIDLREGEAIKISIFWGGSMNDDRRFNPPDLRLSEPGGMLLEEEPFSENHYRVPIESDGIHELTLENTAYTEGSDWRVDIHWYPSSECV